MSIPRTDAVAFWLAANPGQHRARDVAIALDIDNHQASVTLHYLLSMSRVTRQKITGHGMPYSLWSTPATEGDSHATETTQDRPA